MRNKAERKRNTWKAIKRKLNIMKSNDKDISYLKGQNHRLNKQKVQTDKEKSYGEFSHSDKKKLAVAADQEIE